MFLIDLLAWRDEQYPAILQACFKLIEKNGNPLEIEKLGSLNDYLCSCSDAAIVDAVGIKFEAEGRNARLCYFCFSFDS